jgi:hypothetical protein
MEVTVEIPDVYVQRLARWASLSRTLCEAQRLLEQFIPEDAALEDEVQACIQELKDITPAIDALHKAVQPIIWKQE